MRAKLGPVARAGEYRFWRSSLNLALFMVAGAAAGSGAPSSLPRLSAGARLSGLALESLVAASSQGNREQCQRRIDRVKREPALEGAPGLESHRADLLWRAKAEPVLFLRTPRETQPETIEMRAFRYALGQGPGMGYAFSRAYRQVYRRPELARALLLREGYLYAESPELGSVFARAVELNHLFQEPALVIERGSERLTAVRGKFFYEYADGPERGRRATLLLFDRVRVAGAPAEPPLHVSLRTVAARLGFDRLKVERITEHAVLAQLRYGDTWVPSVLGVRGPELALECEAVPAGAEQRVHAARELSLQRGAILASLRRAIQAQVGEALPFDEPRTEDGQQDGHLRPAWKWAFLHGWDTYRFNQEHYRVLDGQGRPLVPQVCMDFITDTLERASGTWWEVRGTERIRRSGRLDFDAADLPNRRNVDTFVAFAESHPEWFDVYHLRPEERVPLYLRDRFYERLFEARDRYLPGDIVTIQGLRDDEEIHNHSFFVYDADPVTGMPMLVAANAGRPRVRSWESEMLSAPRRSIRSRIRPRLPWLQTVIETTANVSAIELAPQVSAPG